METETSNRGKQILRAMVSRLLTVLEVSLVFALFLGWSFLKDANRQNVQANVVREAFDPEPATPSQTDFFFRGAKGWVDVYAAPGYYGRRLWSSHPMESSFSLALHRKIDPRCEFKITLEKKLKDLPESDLEALELMDGFFGSDDMQRLLVRPGVFDALRQLAKFGKFSVEMSPTGLFSITLHIDAAESEVTLKTLIGAGLVIFRQAVILIGEIDPRWTKTKKYSRLRPADVDFFPESLELEALGFHLDAAADLPLSPAVNQKPPE